MVTGSNGFIRVFSCVRLGECHDQTPTQKERTVEMPAYRCDSDFNLFLFAKLKSMSGSEYVMRQFLTTFMLVLMSRAYDLVRAHRNEELQSLV